MDTTNRRFEECNILVAEGEPLLRREVSGALRAMGTRVFEARHGDEAVDIVSSVRIHALVLDSGLPKFGGLETIRVIRTFQNQVPPYLLLARELTRELQVEALDRQATSILPKPVNFEVLLEILASILRRGRGPAAG